MIGIFQTYSAQIAEKRRRHARRRAAGMRQLENGERAAAGSGLLDAAPAGRAA
jgi:hypothetical protein